MRGCLSAVASINSKARSRRSYLTAARHPSNHGVLTDGFDIVEDPPHALAGDHLAAPAFSEFSLRRLESLTPTRLFIPPVSGNHTPATQQHFIAPQSLNGQTDRRHFKLRPSCCVLSASIYLREHSRKHAAELYRQLGSRALKSQSRQGPRKLANSGNFSALNTAGSNSTGYHLGGTWRVRVMQVPLATSPTCSCRRRLISCRHAALWQVLGTELCWAGVSCVTSRLSCDASLSQNSPTLLPMCDTRVIHSLYQHLIWCCLRRMLPVCSRGVTLCDCVTVSLAVLVWKLCAVTLWLHLHLSSEASKVLCDCSAHSSAF